MIVSVRSVKVSDRVIRIMIAPRKALVSPYETRQSNPLGFHISSATSTPDRPSRVAAIRAGVTRSPSIGQASTSRNNCDEKLRVVAKGSSSVLKLMNAHHQATEARHPRLR